MTKKPKSPTKFKKWPAELTKPIETRLAFRGLGPIFGDTVDRDTDEKLRILFRHFDRDFDQADLSDYKFVLTELSRRTLNGFEIVDSQNRKMRGRPKGSNQAVTQQARNIFEALVNDLSLERGPLVTKAAHNFEGVKSKEQLAAKQKQITREVDRLFKAELQAQEDTILRLKMRLAREEGRRLGALEGERETLSANSSKPSDKN